MSFIALSHSARNLFRSRKVWTRSQGGRGFGHVMRAGIPFAHSVGEHGMYVFLPHRRQIIEFFYIGTDHYRNVLHQQLNPSSRSISPWKKNHQGVCGLNAVMEKLMFFVSSQNMKRTVRMPSGLNHLPWVVQGARSMFRRVLDATM